MHTKNAECLRRKSNKITPSQTKQTATNCQNIRIPVSLSAPYQRPKLSQGPMAWNTTTYTSKTAQKFRSFSNFFGGYKALSQILGRGENLGVYWTQAYSHVSYGKGAPVWERGWDRAGLLLRGIWGVPHHTGTLAREGTTYHSGASPLVPRIHTKCTPRHVSPHSSGTTARTLAPGVAVDSPGPTTLGGASGPSVMVTEVDRSGARTHDP